MRENDLKAAFNEIHAEQSLKQETRQFIYNRVYNNEVQNKKYSKNYYNSKRIVKGIVGVVCCIIVLLGVSGYYTYNTPAAVISFDINPSIELEVNIFDKIINVTSYNHEGQSIIDEMSLKNKNYIAAIKEILKNKNIISFLRSNNNIEILITGKNEAKSDTMRDCLLEETNINEENIHCGNWENREIAHSQGLSCGKYRLYLQLHDVNPDITIEDIKDVPMGKLKQMLQDISDNHTNSDENEDNLNQSNVNGNNPNRNNMNENNSNQNNMNGNNPNQNNENESCDSNCGNGQGKKHQHKHEYQN